MLNRYLSVAILHILLIGVAHSEISVTQPDKLSGGFSSYDGKVIQVQIEFKKPLPNLGELTIFSKEIKILKLVNTSETLLDRFVTRLRMKVGEDLRFLVKYPSGEFLYLFKPTVAKDFELPSSDIYNPNVKSVKVENAVMKEPYGALPGDCLFLVQNVSMTGKNVLKSVMISPSSGIVKIEIFDRLSTNPLFGFGVTPPLSKCELKID